MTWVTNKSRPARLTIGGVDHSAALEEVILSDSSAMGAGIIACSGSVKLVQVPGGPNVRDLHGSLFPRGTEVLLDVGNGSGGWVRHPRGKLYVVTSSFDLDANRLELEVGCGLNLRSITDSVADLLSFTTLNLEADARTFQGLSDALYSEGKAIWQDGAGTVALVDVFAGDGLLGAKAAGEWVSVGGQTAIIAQPLGVSTVRPDVINLTYHWRNAIDPTNAAIDWEETTSEYFLEHPAAWLAEVSISGTTTVQVVKRNYAVTSVQTTTKTYGGPGGQVSHERQDRSGPAVELAGQYYADTFEQQRGTIDWYTSRGDPNHGVMPGGLGNVLQSYSERVYTYGPGGELVETVESQYRNTLSCAIPANWQPGAALVDGNIVTVGWRTLNETAQFLNSRTITRYAYYADRTVQETETWQSPCNCNNAGLDAGDINANAGSKRVERRTSRSKLANPAQPDRAPVTTLYKVETGTAKDLREAGSYLPGAAGAGPVTLELQSPSEFNGPASAAAAAASAFLLYARRLLEGDAGGLRVSESLRPEVLADYRPGMPFSYCDPVSGNVSRLRMNATSWAVSGTEALFSTDGLFVGFSNGLLVPGGNTGGTVTPPAITGETFVGDGRSLAVLVSLGASMGISSPDVKVQGAPLGDATVTAGVRQGLIVTGQLVGPGGLLAVTSTGGLAASTNGTTLLTSAATILDSDLFA
jgi:hypothetical protein